MKDNEEKNMFGKFKITIGKWKYNMKNFLKGYGNALNLLPSEKFPRVNIRKLNFPKDATSALRRDWEAVGKDIYKGMSEIDKEINNDIKRRK